MAMLSDKNGYGTAAKALHWLIFLMLLGMSIVGLIFADMPRGEDKTALMNMHASTGLALLVFMLARLVVRLKGTVPDPLDPSARTLNRVAGLVHWLLYLIVFAIIAAGMLTIMTAGRGVPFFGLFEVPTPFVRDMDLHHLWEEVHKTGWWVLVGLFVLHLVAVVYHGFIKRDGTMGRMTGR
ncbi:MAG: cytochrome b [Alphaproteobacteria bacterium]|nr:MAG: cytochrome b [Alphaproteobacteria bacterium]